MRHTNEVIALLEAVSARAGIAVAWFGIPLMIVMAALEPITRWLGWTGDAPFSEASTVAFLAATMTGFGYAYAARAHVRVDVLSRRFPTRLNAALEAAGAVLVLMPLCVLIVVDGTDSTWRSLVLGERWADTGWPAQWLVRMWVPVGFTLLLLAGLASTLRAVLLIARR